MSARETAKQLLESWRSGNEAAAEELHCRYAQRLCRLADAQIGARLGRRVGPEDVVQSAFRTFFRRSADGQFHIDHSGSLWRLLVRITLNKIRQQGERHRAGKRDMAREVYAGSDQLGPEFIARGPTADEAVALAEEIEHLIAGLKSPEPEVFRLRLQGHSTSEIAAQVGCSRWTVRRVLDRVGEQLEERLAQHSAD